MGSMHNMTGLAGAVVAIAASLMLVPGIERLTKSRMVLLMGAILGAALLPLGELPAAAYVRSVIGDLSITTILWLGYGLLRPLLGGLPIATRTRVVLQALVAIAAVALYPLALGIGLFDPYRLGYGNPWFLGGLLALALATWFARFYIIALSVAFAVLAWAIGWYESNNLWDYLLDPLVSLYALGAIVYWGMKALRAPRGAIEEERGLRQPITPRS